MTYIADNTVCRYFPFEVPESLIAIGWLDGSHDFPRGRVSRDFFLRLCDLIQDPWQPLAACGYHTCELCQFSGGGDATFEERRVPGSSVANVFVPHDGRVFVAPELIAHYIDAHGYQPPEPFIQAVLACPPMRSMPYKTKLLRNGGREIMEAAKAALDSSTGTG